MEYMFGKGGKVRKAERSKSSPCHYCTKAASCAELDPGCDLWLRWAKERWSEIRIAAARCGAEIEVNPSPRRECKIQSECRRNLESCLRWKIYFAQRWNRTCRCLISKLHRTVKPDTWDLLMKKLKNQI